MESGDDAPETRKLSHYSTKEGKVPKKNPRKRKVRITLMYGEWRVVTRAFYLADQHKYQSAEWAMECADRKEVYDKIIGALLPYVPREGGEK